MADPTLVVGVGALAARFIGSATDLTLCSLAASVIGNRVDSFAMDSYERIRARLGEADKADPLRNNHHLARGTIRAALLATLSCVDRILDGDDSEALSHSGSYNLPPDALRKTLASMIPNLECADARGGRAVNRRKFEAALREGALLLGAPDLDRAGSEVIGLQNKPGAEAPAGEDVNNVTEARERMLPGLADAVTIKVLAWGEYDDADHERIAAVVRDEFFGPEEHWFNDFGHFYAAELRQDTNLHRLAAVMRADRVDRTLERLEGGIDDARRLWEAATENYEGLADRIGDLNQLILRKLDAIEETRKDFSLAGNDVFVRFAQPQEQPAGRGTDYSSFYFAKEEDEFVGREEVLEQIRERFLEDPAKFAWMAVCGDAATGKSRLAFQLIKDSEIRWRLSGFVRGEVVRNAEVVVKGGETISDPTLFVVDYVGNAPGNCVSFIEQCAALAQHAAFPIRVLVLVRRPSDRFFDLVETSEGMAAGDSQIAFEYDDGRNLDSSALILEPLSEPEVLDLMRSRMALTAAIADPSGTLVPVREADDELLLEYLDYFDPHRRPLFATMVADGLQRDVLSQETLGENQEEARLRLFWKYLERQYEKRWRHAAESAATLDRHLTFLILSTMCRGLTDEGWHRLNSDEPFGKAAKLMLPAHPDDMSQPDPDWHLEEGTVLQSIAGGRRNSEEDPYPILEPDLIGESLVLYVLGERQRAEKMCSSGSAVAGHRIKYLRDMAWVADPDGAAFFASLVAEDFPDQAKALSWLLPTQPREENAVARSSLLRNLSSVAIDAFRSRAANSDDLERIDALLANFEMQEEAPEEAMHHMASALSGLCQHVSFVINKATAPRGKIEIVPIEDPRRSGRKVFNRTSGSGRAGEDWPATGGLAQGDFEAAATGADDEDGMQVFERKSDAAAVALALVVLRKAFEIAEERVLAVYPFETRLRFANVVHLALVSLLWDDRNDESRFGFAGEPLSKEEVGVRQALTEKLDAHLDANSLDEEVTAIAAKIMYALFYAEVKPRVDRGRKVYDAIGALVEAEGFQRSDTCRWATKFLINYSVGLSHGLGDAEPAVVREHFDELLARARRLAGVAMGLENLASEDRRDTVAAYCGVALRVARRYIQSGLPAEGVLKEATSDYVRFGEARGYDPIGTSAVDLSSQYVAVAKEQEQSVDEFAEALEAIATTVGFDRSSLNEQNWPDLRYVLATFSTCEPSNWPSFSKVVERMAADGGKRIRDELADILKDGTGIHAERAVSLVETADPDGCQQPEARLAVFAAGLQEELDDWTVEEINRWWSDGETDDDLRARILALRSFSLFVRWHGVDDPRVGDFRARLLALLKDSSKPDDEIDPRIRQEHDATVADVASILADLEITAGRSPDDWIANPEGT